LKVGDPSDVATGVGPLIVAEALDTIGHPIQRLKLESKVLVEPVESAQAATQNIANLIAPHAFEVARIAGVKAEIFGPELQVVRWSGAPRQSSPGHFDSWRA
jgi:RHH-type proline utilization regulon transcriptional repressor/proline dehydrogenase/delta 1-pyrroline-5-carboxylate dehydrogenase